MTATFQKVTGATYLTTVVVTMNDRDVQFSDNTSAIAKLNMFGRVVDAQGRVIAEFEKTLDAKQSPGQSTAVIERSLTFENTFPLRGGLYNVEVVVKDVNKDKTGTRTCAIRVPD